MTDQTLLDVNLKDILARIDRNQAETGKLIQENQKFVAEQHKLIEERLKLVAEQEKLSAEANKLKRDHGLAPISALVSIAGASAALVVAIVSLLKSMGVL